MGILSNLFGGLFNNSRSGEYGRLVAWVEKRYGTIGPNASIGETRAKFSNALNEGASKKGEKAVAGLKRYIELEKYKGLIKQ